MSRRLIVAILLLAIGWQGPALAYSAALSTPNSHASGGMPCADHRVLDRSGCDGCCSQGSGFCAAACALALTAMMPTAVAAAVSTLPRLPVPDADKPAPVERHRGRLFRPPIV